MMSPRIYFIFYLCWVLLFIIPSLGYAASIEQEVESVLLSDAGKKNIDDFFDEINIEDQTPSAVLLKNKRYSGKIKTELAYNTEKTDKTLPFSRKNSGPSKLKTSLNMHFEDKIGSKFNYKISANGFYDAYYDIKADSNFSTEQINAFETEIEFRETYFNFWLNQNISLTIGRQIIAWGESEVTPVLDIINPRDVREFGQTPLDEMRIPVSAARLSATLGNLELDYVYSFEFRGDKTGVNGSDFDPTISLRSILPITSPRKPYTFFDGGEQYFRLKKQFNNTDLAIFLSDSYQKSPTLAYNIEQQSLLPMYKRYQLLGLSGSFTTGSWLTRLELAYKRNIAEPRNDLLQQIETNKSIVASWSEKNIVQTTLGAEYYGFTNTSITLEWTPTVIIDYAKNLLNDKLMSAYLFFYRRTFLNERIALDLSWFKFGDGDGDIIRTNLEYEYQDGMRLSISYIAYEANTQDSFLYNYRNNDRIISSISYFF